MAADLSQFVEMPESPQITGEGTTKETVRIYTVNNSLDWVSKLPARAESGTDGFFSRYSSRHGPGYTVVSLYWSRSLSDPGSIARSRADGTVESDLTVDLVEKPIESHPDYKMYWNYDLWQSSATDPGMVAPEWATTATDSSDANGVDYVWSKTKPAQTDTDKQWWKIQARIKAGVESYLLVQPVVTDRKYCKNKATALSYLLTAGGEAAPTDGYAWGETSANWLGYPIGLTLDGDFWVAQNEYRYADSWDDDLYGST